MYVSEKDIEALRQMIAMVQGAVEGGPDDEEWWENFSKDANSLYKKALKSHYREMDIEIRDKFNKYVNNDAPKQLERLFDRLGENDGIMLQSCLEDFVKRILEQRLEPRQSGTTVMRLKWSDVNFVIKYMIKNTNTERIDVEDHYGIEKLTDTVFSEYQDWKNKTTIL